MNPGTDQVGERPINFQLFKLYIESINNFSGSDDFTIEILLEHCES